MRSSGPRDPDPKDVLESVARRVLWLGVRMIHEANHVRPPSRDGLKVGGHQASSASVVSILTALYFRWLRPQDLVSIKPHASPVYHAVRYLLGDLDRSYLPTLRAFGGLQSYPSRTKDPDRVDFSTGSVGLGAVTPIFAALADRYLRSHLIPEMANAPDRRFVAVVGDAELDEGNVWEAVLEESLGSLGNVTILVDLNRQSLDRVVPGIRIRKLEAMFAAAGWQVAEIKYGSRLRAAFARPGGPVLRRRIDQMANEEYHALIRSTPGDLRDRLILGTPTEDRDSLARNLAPVSDDELVPLLMDLGGHDVDEIVRALETADLERDRPSVLFAYTLKGWSLPFAGDPLNHSALMTQQQIDGLALALGADPSDPWAGFEPGTPERRLCDQRGHDLRAIDPRPPAWQPSLPEDLDVRFGARGSSQEAFGNVLAALARQPVGARIVTASPDVSVSTSLGGWINRAGVFSTEEATIFDEVPRALSWRPSPTGRHIELGISEMNLFLLLSQFGLTRELFGQALIPIGTVYDPFISRGLDALVHGLYSGARFILVGTPSGISLAPEGGAHQSSITPSLGIELPGLRAYEPAFAQEAAWMLLAAIDACADRTSGSSTYLRLSTRPVDQALAQPIRDRVGDAEWRRQVLAGGYRLLRGRDLAPDLPVDAPGLNVMAAGAVVPEAAAAVTFLAGEGVAANLIVVTSAERLATELHERRLAAIRDRLDPHLPHLSELIPADERHIPIVTVADSASHALSFIGSVFGAPVVPLGVDTFGQSGTIADLYEKSGIDAEHIIEASLMALELA